jgi:hypothetical protein
MPITESELPKISAHNLELRVWDLGFGISDVLKSRAPRRAGVDAAVVASVPSPSFPHLWKTLWKSRLFESGWRENRDSRDVSEGERSREADFMARAWG